LRQIKTTLANSAENVVTEEPAAGLDFGARPVRPTEAPR